MSQRVYGKTYRFSRSNLLNFKLLITFTVQLFGRTRAMNTDWTDGVDYKLAREVTIVKPRGD